MGIILSFVPPSTSSLEVLRVWLSCTRDQSADQALKSLPPFAHSPGSTNHNISDLSTILLHIKTLEIMLNFVFVEEINVVVI